MLDAFRTQLAWRSIRKAVRVRRVPTGAARPVARALIVLPSDEASLRAAWALVQMIDLPVDRIVTLVVGDDMPYVPDQFAGGVQRAGREERTWLGVLRPATTALAWKGPPDVALNMAQPDDVAAAFLVGASPAAVRVGFYSEIAAECYDLMCHPSDRQDDPYSSMLRVLSRLKPPVLPFR